MFESRRCLIEHAEDGSLPTQRRLANDASVPRAHSVSSLAAADQGPNESVAEAIELLLSSLLFSKGLATDDSGRNALAADVDVHRESVPLITQFIITDR